MSLTPRERVMITLRGGIPDKTPFTTYSEFLPQCSVERELRNRGLCMVARTTSYRMFWPNVKIQSLGFTDEQGRNLTRTTYSTPHGDLTTLREPAGFTSWLHEAMFKTPDDYKALRFLIEDTVVEPDYARVSGMLSMLGDDFVVRDCMCLEPLQGLISGEYMRVEDFCIEWMDRRDEILNLYHALVEVARKIYPIVADGPLEFANYGGNVVPQIIGSEAFSQYYIPNYNEAAEVLHRKGKLIGTHLDADNTPIMDLVGQTDLDYIEAYDPGISPHVSDALKAWPEKSLWINWPSAWHLKPVQEVYDCTLELIHQAGNGGRFIIGITEDVPADRWQSNFQAIMDAVDLGVGSPHSR